MKKQVDQSGRIEDARQTVWAYADGATRSLAMAAAVKRKAFAALRHKRITGARALVRIYTAAIFLLLRDIVGIQGIRIELDREYPGYEADIKAMLLRKLRRVGLKVSADAITVISIGKQSRAHKLA